MIKQSLGKKIVQDSNLDHVDFLLIKEAFGAGFFRSLKFLIPISFCA
jgi:hypothetical protein